MTINRPLLKNGFSRGASALFLSAAIGLTPFAVAQTSTSSQSTQATSGQRTDGQIEMDVVRALDASQALQNDLITAATIQSEVTLAGTVSSESSKQLAENIAGQVTGVTKVHNNLKIGDPQAAQDDMAPPPQDAQDATGAVAGAPPQNQQPYNGQQSNNQAYGDQAPPPPQQGQDQYPDQGQYSAPPPRPQYGAQAPYPPQRYPGSPYPRQAQQYPQPQQQAYAPAHGPVTIPEGTLLQLRTNEALTSKHASDGTPVQFTVIQDVTSGGALAIPRGATVHGVVTETKKSGDLGGSAELALTLTSLDLGGQAYPLESDQFRVKGPNKAGQTVGNAVGAGLIGTIIGCAVGRGVGCAVGAGVGVAAGTAASAASSGPPAWIPAEALVSFHLATPITIAPVSQQEAARLAQGLYPGGPSLYQRGPYGSPYARRYPAGPYYAYPQVYYRPYYRMGGAYYWR